eukprot:COSAG02_NODE_39076_length_421_cov_0.968944_2_plen_79_part_01
MRRSGKVTVVVFTMALIRAHALVPSSSAREGVLRLRIAVVGRVVRIDPPVLHRAAEAPDLVTNIALALSFVGRVAELVG